MDDAVRVFDISLGFRCVCCTGCQEEHTKQILLSGGAGYGAVQFFDNLSRLHNDTPFPSYLS